MKVGVPGDRAERLRRRADPGGGREPRRLRGHLPAERARLGGGPADQRDHGSLCAGGAVYSPALTDFIFMVEKSSYMFITGPDVIKTVTHEEVTKEELGGARTHNFRRSGVAHFACSRRRGLPRRGPRAALVPSRRTTTRTRRSRECLDPADREDRRARRRWCPRDPMKPYDIKRVIEPAWWTTADFFEVQPALRAEHRGRLRALRGPPGRHRRQPADGARGLPRHRRVGEGRRASSGSATASTCRFVTFVDVPGFLPGTDQEYGGIIKHGAKLLYAYCEATFPRSRSSRARPTAARTTSWRASTCGAT